MLVIVGTIIGVLIATIAAAFWPILLRIALTLGAFGLLFGGMYGIAAYTVGPGFAATFIGLVTFVAVVELA